MPQTFTGDSATPEWDDTTQQKLDKFLMLSSKGGGGIPTFGGGGSSSQPTGAANESNGQTTLSATSAQLVPARPTRTGVVIVNIDAAITIYLGPAGVTSSTGLPLAPGQSVPLTWVGAIYAVAGSATPKASFWDEYN